MIIRLADSVKRPAHMQPQQIHTGQLRRIGLGGRDRNLRSCPCVKYIIRLSCDRAADHIDHAEHPRALRLGCPQRRQRIQCFTGLTDRNEQRPIIDQRIAVAELRSDIDLDRDLREPFDDIFADQTRVISRTARHDIDAANPCQILLCQRNPVQANLAGRIQPAADRLADCLRLLIDLLEHEMRIALFFGGIHIPGHMKNLAMHRFSLLVENLDFVRRDDNHFPVFNQVDFLAVFEQRRNIRSDEIFAITDARDQRCVLADCYDLIRVLAGNDCDRIGAGHLQCRRINRILQCCRPLHMQTDQMRHDLCIRFRTELHMVLCNQAFL